MMSTPISVVMIKNELSTEKSLPKSEGGDRR